MECSQVIVRAGAAAVASWTGGLCGGGAAIIANQMGPATVESGDTAISIGSNAIAKATEKGGVALAVSLPNDNVGVAVGSFIGYIGYKFLVDCFQNRLPNPNPSSS